jgi:hypothetical protein
MRTIVFLSRDHPERSLRAGRPELVSFPLSMVEGYLWLLGIEVVMATGRCLGGDYDFYSTIC